MSVHSEAAFEESIEAHLLGNGWIKTDPKTYDRKLGLFPSEVIAFLKESQPKEWAKYVTNVAGEAAAEQKITKWLAEQIDQRGTIDVLRGVIKHSGVTFRTSFFNPANTLTPELGRAVRSESSEPHTTVASLGIESGRFARPRTGRQRCPRGDGRAEESVDAAERRERDGSVSFRPQSGRPDLR